MRADFRKPNAASERSALFEAAFQENYDLLYRYLRRRVDSEAASDLAAETFSTAIREFDSFDPARGSIRAWLFGIATNHLRRETRRETRELRAFARTGVDPVVDDPTASVDRKLDAQQLHKDLAYGLSKLSGSDRDALLLFCWADLNYSEISEALDVPIGTVKSRIARARRVLRPLVEPESFQPCPLSGEEVTSG